MVKANMAILHILLFFFAVGFGHKFAEKYELVEDSGQDAEEWFERSHRIVRRAARNSSIPTSNSTTSTNTTAKPATPTTGPSVTTYTSPVKTSVSSRPTNSLNGTNSTNNISIIEDNHKYYLSQYYPFGEKWWFDLERSGTPNIHVGLSKNLQYSDMINGFRVYDSNESVFKDKFETISTSFQFPYYGHLINKVTITNKGFLFLGEKLHKFNASAQYVAPLMANFGPHLHENTTIRYVDTGDRFTVEWTNIRLLNQTAGEFSFQCSIFKNGTLVFAYKKISAPVSEIKNDTFFVRVGLSDSYVIRYIRHGIFLINGRLYFSILYTVYYRYHVVTLPWSNIKSGSAYVMTPLPNCVLFKTCESCVGSTTVFSCKWCPRINRCSDGIDRHRHEWLVNGCPKMSKTTCAVRPTRPNYSPKRSKTTKQVTTKTGGEKGANKDRETKTDSPIGMIFLILLVVGILVALTCWFVYAYRYPQSSSGMFLIKYGNPRKWCQNTNGVGSKPSGNSVSFKSMSI